VALNTHSPTFCINFQYFILLHPGQIFVWNCTSDVESEIHHIIYIIFNLLKIVSIY